MKYEIFAIIVAITISLFYTAGKHYAILLNQQKLLTNTILDQKSTILQLKANNLYNETIINSYVDQINYVNNTNNLIKGQLLNVQKRLDKSNHINGLLVQLVNEQAMSTNMPFLPGISDTAKNINGKSSTYQTVYSENTSYNATEFTSYIVDQFSVCEKNTNQLEQLQDWIRHTEK